MESLNKKALVELVAQKTGNTKKDTTDLVDHVFEELSDRSIQRLLRDVENAQIEIIIKGLHEPAKRKLFNNLSKRLAVMIANDVNVMDRISASEIVNEAKKTVECLKSLYNQAEIFDLDIDNLP